MALGASLANLLAFSLITQALILMGAGLQVFANRPVFWFGAVFVFSAALPVVIAALHQAWVALALGMHCRAISLCVMAANGQSDCVLFRSTAYG